MFSGLTGQMSADMAIDLGTANTLVAITGEGFLQVQDPDGNIYYTKAGMLNIDTNGRLVDTNGNFVLGTGATSGQLNSTEPGRSIIQITVDPVEPAYAMLETTVLGKALKITSEPWQCQLYDFLKHETQRRHGVHERRAARGHHGERQQQYRRPPE